MIVTALLTREMQEFMRYEYTASLETHLDAISAGKLMPSKFMHEWWQNFQRDVAAVAAKDKLMLRDGIAEDLDWQLFPAPVTGGAENANDAGTNGVAAPASAPPVVNGAAVAAPSAEPSTEPSAEPSTAPAAAPVDNPRACPKCPAGVQKLMIAPKGAFIGCSAYPACTYSRPIDAVDVPATATAQDDDGKPDIAQPCPLCGGTEGGGTQTLKHSRYGAFLGCSTYPECKWTGKVGGGANKPASGGRGRGGRGRPKAGAGKKAVAK